MKSFVAILALPVIAVLYFYASKLYVAEQFFAAYTLVLTALTSLVLSIQHLGIVLDQPKAEAPVIPVAPRAYISHKKAS
jgi:hypothetical protein